MNSFLHKVLTLVFVLTLVLTACGMPARNSNAGSAESDAPDLPTGFTDLLEQKVAAGEWTLEEGLVTLLKLFADEIKAKQADLGEGVLEAEGTGVLELAVEYLQAGTDESTKAEIARLLNVLIPSQAALDNYSIPADQVSQRLPGSASLAQVEEECAALWAAGFPDSRDPSFRCFMYGEAVAAGQRYRVYYPLAWREDARLNAVYEATLDAAVSSINTYQAYGTVRPIYFVFTPRANADNPTSTLAIAAWEAFRPGEACPVIIYPMVFTLTRQQFQQTIAHEVFHCFEAWNLRDQGIGAGYNSSKWWVEGAAEYFSNLVYPSINYEYRFADSFSRLSNTRPLTAMTYENFAFFQFLGNQLGPAGVVAFVRQMPVAPGVDQQLAALSAVPRIEDLWEGFARAVFDRTLLDSDGSVANIPGSYTNQFTLNGAGSVTMSGRPFVLARYQLVFGGEKEFVVTETTAGAGRSAARPGGVVAPWQPLPATLGDCSDRAYVVYTLTTTVGAERVHTVTVPAVTDLACDRCVVGTWRSTPESVLGYFQSILAQTRGASESVDVAEVSGAMVAEFREDGTGSFGYDNLVVHQVLSAVGVLGGPAMQTDIFISFSGTTTGTYRADGTNITGAGPGAGIQVTVDTYVNNAFMGTTNIPIRPEDFPVGAPLPTRYTCSGNTLTMWPPVSGVPDVHPIEYRRVSR